LALELPVATIDADDAEPAALVESNARGVLRKDPGHDLPEAALGVLTNESLQSRTPRTGAARIPCDIHRVLGDPGIRRPVSIRPGARPRHDLPAAVDHHRRIAVPL